MSLIKRILKNPETIPIKLIRTIKRLKKIKYENSHPQKINDNAFIFNKIESDEIIQEANKILNKEYEIFNKEYKIDKINWHKDYNSEYIWPLENFNLDKENTDKKISWELNRFQHLTTLALAYNQTKDEKYFIEIESQIKDWIEQNPFGKGINWSTPMECAVRAINLIQIYFLTEKKLDILTLIYNHGIFIKENIEWTPAKENHYLTDLLGLFWIGILFNKEGWIRFSKKELEKEIRHQVSEDGVDYESSLNYHRLVTEIFTITLILATKNNIDLSNTFKSRIENMCEFIMYYTPESGNAPSIGDTDNSRILDIWDKNINNHLELLAIASVLFNREDFKAYSTTNPKLFLILNKEKYNQIKENRIELKSKSFKDYYILRNKEIYILIHCGSIGRNNFGGHGHNDQLSFILSTKEDLIIDPGTYTYTGDLKLRNIFRSTSYHNTILLDKQEQNLIESVFNMEHKSYARIIKFESNSEKDIFIGEHKGFNQKVRRQIILDKKENKIIITDSIEKDNNLTLNLHLHPEIKIENTKNKLKLNNSIIIETEDKPIILDTFYSENYGKIAPSKAIQIKKYGKTLTTKIKF